MSDAEKVAYATRLFGTLFGLAVRAVSEKYGTEGLDYLRTCFFDCGNRLGANDIRRLKPDEMNAKGYHRLLVEALSTFGIPYEVKELSDKRYVVRLHDCPHAKNFSDVGAPPGICDVFLAWDEGLVRALNPRFEFKLTKYVLRGDPYCEYVLEEK